MPELIEQGHLYVAKAPLFHGKVGREKRYYWSLEEARTENATSLQRYKGLGEMNEDELAETTLDPNTRLLEQISIGDVEEVEQTLSLLMENDNEGKKRWIRENVIFD